MANFRPITEDEAKDPRFQSGGTSTLGATYAGYTRYLEKGWLEYKTYGGTIPRYEIPKLQEKMDRELSLWRTKTGGQTKMSKIVQKSTGKRASVVYNTGTLKRPSHDAGSTYDLIVRYQLLLPVQPVERQEKPEMASVQEVIDSLPEDRKRFVNLNIDRWKKWYGEWESYRKLSSESLNEIYRRTSRLDLGDLRGVDKQSKISTILDNKFGSPSKAKERIAKITGLSEPIIESWLKNLAKGSSGAVPSARPAEPKNSTPKPASGRFQNQNRLGWSREGYSTFYEFSKPGGKWTFIKKNYDKSDQYSPVAANIQVFINLFSDIAKYAPLVGMFTELQKLHNAARPTSSLSAPMDQSKIEEMRALMSRIQPRLARLYDFARQEALAKSIVIKSLGKRLI